MSPQTAADRWSSELADWAIPEHITAAADRSPWGFPVQPFADRADAALAARDPSPTIRAARAWLTRAPGPSRSVLDVGAGVGAASLPLLPEYADRAAAVDELPEMLEQWLSRAAARLSASPPLAATPATRATRAFVGRWPDLYVADPTGFGSFDVVICAQVVYGIADIVPFLKSLTDASCGGVVVELSAEHPLAWMAPLWKEFHGLERPTGPRAEDLCEVLRENGITDLQTVRWTEPAPADPARAARTTRRLCLPPEREPQVAEALGRLDVARTVVTLSWPGGGRADVPSLGDRS